MIGEKTAATEAFWQKMREQHGIAADDYHCRTFGDPRFDDYGNLVWTVSDPDDGDHISLDRADVNGFDRLATRFDTFSLILSRNGTVAANSTMRWSRMGTRASSELAMLIRSTFVRMSSGRYIMRS